MDEGCIEGRMKTAETHEHAPVWRAEAAFLHGAATVALFYFFGKGWLSNLHNFPVTIALFIWLFAIMLWCAFGVVRHADALAQLLGEPYGTLILTLSVIGIEVALISAIMLHGDNNPALARDAMFAVLMIVLNGLVGLAILLGALRHREQSYNLQGARAFLVVIIPLSIFSLVLPKYTTSTSDASFSTSQAVTFTVLTILLYVIFLAIQTMRHSGFFTEVEEAERQQAGHPEQVQSHHAPPRSILYHTVFLILTLLPVVLLSKSMATVVDFGIEELKLPEALGGVLIALLVLSPEGLAALRAARANHLQRAVNVCLGSALATIGLTIPAVLTISLLTDRHILLGLTNVETVLLILTVFVSALTFGGARTSVLQGAVHLVLFITYVALIFSP